MKEEDNTPEHNSFLARGCCSTPCTNESGESNYCNRSAKLDVHDWLGNINLPNGQLPFNFVEVRFKNSRKGFYQLPDDISVNIGDIVAVEASPGHDIGIVSLTGELVRLQMRKKHTPIDPNDIRKIYRKARPNDIEKWIKAVSREDETMFQTRVIARELGLSMKINDVEYQGDNTKSIFYYTADDRVDFRQLIKVLAETFRIRIEMRQIGVRQEAGRLGGIGSCGRELCCSTWITSFQSVTTAVARTQQLSLNPQKLAGQCGKLKCCLNYEYSTYVDAISKFPQGEVVLLTKAGKAIHMKTDVFKKTMWFIIENKPGEMFPIPLDAVKKIIQLNEKGRQVDDLSQFVIKEEDKTTEFRNDLNQGDLSRFDRK